MDASQIAFGVEFETHLSSTDDTPIGAYHRGAQVPWLPLGWRAERDGSIRCPAGRKACEFVSPILCGEAGLAQLDEALQAIQQRDAQVNASCGLHVTLAWHGDAAALARLISLVGNHEQAIFASTGSATREAAVYTKRIKPYGGHDAAQQKCTADRYHLLNLTHLARGQNRIEFRAFAGTLNRTKVLGHVLMCLGLVELALHSKRRAEWDYAKEPGTRSCWDRPGAGPGETELNRLFYRLGWTKGWYKGALRAKVFGQAGAADLKRVKAKLLELARKYDAARAAAGHGRGAAAG